MIFCMFLMNFRFQFFFHWSRRFFYSFSFVDSAFPQNNGAHVILIVYFQNLFLFILRLPFPSSENGIFLVRTSNYNKIMFFILFLSLSRNEIGQQYHRTNSTNYLTWLSLLLCLIFMMKRFLMISIRCNMCFTI